MKARLLFVSSKGWGLSLGEVYTSVNTLQIAS